MYPKTPESVVVDQNNTEDVNSKNNHNESPTPRKSAPVVLKSASSMSTLGFMMSLLNLVNNILSGAVVGAVYIFAFQQETFDATPLHAVLCVTGYHLIMGQAILCLAPQNGWTAKINIDTRKKLHSVMLFIGSALAIAGSFIKITDKDTHWDTYHGKFALFALVLTIVSLSNGIILKFEHKIRGIWSGKLNVLTKLCHICTGKVAFIAANVTLCIGIQKEPFVEALNQGISNAFVAFTVIVAVLVIISPVKSFYRKSKRLTR